MFDSKLETNGEHFFFHRISRLYWKVCWHGKSCLASDQRNFLLLSQYSHTHIKHSMTCLLLWQQPPVEKNVWETFLSFTWQLRQWQQHSQQDFDLDKSVFYLEWCVCTRVSNGCCTCLICRLSQKIVFEINRLSSEEATKNLEAPQLKSFDELFYDFYKNLSLFMIFLFF